MAKKSLTPEEVEKLLQDLSSDVSEVDEGEEFTIETDNSDSTTDSSGSDNNTVYLTAKKTRVPQKA